MSDATLTHEYTCEDRASGRPRDRAQNGPGAAVGAGTSAFYKAAAQILDKAVVSQANVAQHRFADSFEPYR